MTIIVDSPETVAAKPDSPRPQVVLDRLGGISGLVYSAVPVVAFVPLSVTLGLMPAVVGALVAAAAVLGWRLIRRESVVPAVLGFGGVAVCVVTAYLTGESKGYFLIGIWISLFWAVVFGGSVLIRRPISGYLWSWFGGDSGWRQVRRAMFAFDVATVFWAVVFAARFVVQGQLYDADQTGWLGFARLIMGWPLAAVGAVITYYAVKVAKAALQSAARPLSLPPVTE